MQTIGERLGHLVALAGEDLSAIDKLARLADGHTGQIARGGRKDPSARTLVKLGRVLGTTAEWLLDGTEDAAPSKRAVRAAVDAAWERAGGKHVGSVAMKRAAGKVNGSTGDSNHRSRRAVGSRRRSARGAR